MTETPMQRSVRMSRELRGVNLADHLIRIVEVRLQRGSMSRVNCSCGMRSALIGQYHVAQERAIEHLKAQAS